MDSKGVAFGLQGNLYLPVVVAAVVSVGLFTVLLVNTSMPVPKAFAVASAPFAVTLLFVMLFLNGKRPHYAADLFASLTSDGGFSRPFVQPQHPVTRAMETAEKKREISSRHAASA